MLDELLGRKKTTRRQNVVIAEASLGLRTLHEARTELAEEICNVMITLKRTTGRLAELPDALETCEHERFRAMTQHELFPDRQKDREPEFAERRAGLLTEQQVLTGKRTALEVQRNALETQMGDLKRTIDIARVAMWEEITKHLSEGLGINFRSEVIALWTAVNQLKDGSNPVMALDRALDFRSFDDSLRISCLEKLRLEFDVPA
jgi:hypothetical protein